MWKEKLHLARILSTFRRKDKFLLQIIMWYPIKIESVELYTKASISHSSTLLYTAC